MNLQHIRKKLKNSPRLDCVYLCLKSLKDVNECKKITATKRSPYNILVNSYGSEAKDKWIYYINLGDSYKTNGFCSLILDTLLFLDYADTFHLEPVVCWGEETLYYDSTIEKNKNVFEYYFEPVSEINYDDVKKCFRVTNGKEADRYLNYEFNHYVHDSEEIEGLAQTWKKYIKLNQSINEIITENISKVLGSYHTLGVHVRATDYNVGYNNHPKIVTPQEYLEEVKIACEKYEFEKVFLATDDMKVVDLFKQELGEKLIYYVDSFRSSNGSPVHYGNIEIQRKNHKFLLGLEIIKDVYTLGECSGLIAGKSNVSQCARLIKRSSGQEYKYKKIIDKGININNNKSRAGIDKKLR